MSALEPWTPSVDDPWDEVAAAHLLRRAAFGAGPGEARALAELDVDEAVRRVVDVPRESPELAGEIRRVGGELDEQAGEAATMDGLRRLWFFRMARSRPATAERIALFWHGHFATQEQGGMIAPALFRRQLALFHAHGLGSFEELVTGVARDPAMLVYLDNRLSRKERPNENWARELCELFTLGVDRYSQRDVDEIARVFTGWTTPHVRSTRFTFESGWHDGRDKVVFGRRIEGRFGDRGQDEGDDVIALILARPESRRFVARKLLGAFVTRTPSAATVDALAEVLRESEWDVRAALRALFRSRLFFAHRFNLYRSPVELTVTALRALDVQNPHLADPEAWTRRMGQELFDPPSVAGWPGGPTWIASSSLLERSNFAAAVASLPHTTRPVVGRAAFDVDVVTGGHDDADALVRHVALRLLGRPLEERRAALVTRHLDETFGPGASRDRTRATLHLVLASPEAQLG